MPLLLLLFFIVLSGCDNMKTKPDINIDSSLALEIGKTILIYQFSDKIDLSTAQFHVIDNDKSWRIENTVNTDIKNTMTVTLGGVYYVEISKSDCRIIKIGVDD